MIFRTRLEAYSHAIFHLDRLAQNLPLQKNALLALAERFKVAFENHEEDIKSLAALLQPVIEQLPIQHAKRLSDLKIALIKCQDSRTTHKYTPSELEYRNAALFKNPLERRFQSLLFIDLLQNPTKAMMDSVQVISNQIIRELDLIKDEEGAISDFLNGLINHKNLKSFGSFSSEPTLEEVKSLLKENDPSKLAEIMHVHFHYAIQLLRDVPVPNDTSSNSKPRPSQTVLNILKEHILDKMWGPNGLIYDFYKGIEQDDIVGEEYRIMIAQAFYNSKLYEEERNHNSFSSGVNHHVTSHEMGILLPDQSHTGPALPRHASVWAPTVKSLIPDLKSFNVRQLNDHEAVYVGGPSGSTAVLLCQMEVLGKFQQEEPKRNYLSVIASYLIAGGFNSLAEIIAPAEHILNLVPGLQVNVPHEVPKPINYHTFYAQQEACDPEFAEKRAKTWKTYTDTLFLAPEVHQYLIKTIDDYIKSRSGFFMSFIVSCSPRREHEYKAAIYFKDFAKQMTQACDLLELISDYRKHDDEIKSTFKHADVTDFERCLNKLEQIIKHATQPPAERITPGVRV